MPAGSRDTAAGRRIAADEHMFPLQKPISQAESFRKRNLAALSCSAAITVCAFMPKKDARWWWTMVNKAEIIQVAVGRGAMKRLVALVGLALLAGCQAPSAPTAKTQPKPYSMTKEDVQAVEAGIKVRLKDPTSPLFGPMKAANQGASVTVCGTVNSKNSFGGYTGYQPYAGVLYSAGANRAFTLDHVGNSPYAQQFIYERCRREGAV